MNVVGGSSLLSISLSVWLVTVSVSIVGVVRDKALSSYEIVEPDEDVSLTV